MSAMIPTLYLSRDPDRQRVRRPLGRPRLGPRAVALGQSGGRQDVAAVQAILADVAGRRG